MGDSLFYSRVGDAGWEQDFILSDDMKWRSMMCSRYFGMAAGMERFSVDLTQTVRNVAGCGSVWNSWLQTDLRWKLCILRWQLVTCGSPVYLVVVEFSTCVLWSLSVGLTLILLVIMVWFHSWGIDAILGNRYRIQEQICVVLIQASKM